MATRCIMQICLLLLSGNLSAQHSIHANRQGDGYAIILCENGNVVSWGNNTSGKLGDGTTLDRPYPVQVKNLENVKTVYTGHPFSGSSYAVKEDGTVWGWGSNSFGQLGLGSDEPYITTPTQLPKLNDVEMLSISNVHALALKKDGTVWSWGWNGHGQVGDGTFTNRNEPVQVLGISNIILIQVSGHTSAAIKEDGTVWTWGRNLRGKLGIGVGPDIVLSSAQPLQVKGLSEAEAFFSGWSHSNFFVLKKDNSMWGWGGNEFGNLGIDSDIDSFEPLPVVNGSNIVSIINTNIGAYFIREDGTLWGMGFNNPILTPPPYEHQYIPVKINGLPEIKAFDAGSAGVALTMDSLLFTWGRNFYGLLGDSTIGEGEARHTPQSLYGLPPVVNFARGNRNIFAIGSDNSVWSWGLNNFGQLGDGSFEDRSVPARVMNFPLPPQPDTIFGALLPVPGNILTYTADSVPGIMNYRWTLPDDWEVSGEANGLSVTVQAGTASGEVCVSAYNGCAEGKEYCYFVSPMRLLGNDTTLCTGDTLLLEPNIAPWESVIWSTGDTAHKLAVFETGDYHIRVSGSGYMQTDTIKVHFTDRPHVYIGPDSSFCSKIDYLIKPETDGKIYEWNTGETKKNLHVTEEGLYALRVWNDYMCHNADTTRLTELSPPYGLDVSEIETCDAYVELDAGNEGANYQWSTGDTTRSVRIESSGTYFIEIDNGFCSIRDSVAVVLKPVIECESHFWMPNAFKPGGLNDRFKPVYNDLVDFEMAIYDRWGSLLFLTDDADSGWDGKVDGEIAPEGVYVYTVKITFEYNDYHLTDFKNGTFLLMR